MVHGYGARRSGLRLLLGGCRMHVALVATGAPTRFINVPRYVQKRRPPAVGRVWGMRRPVETRRYMSE